MPFSVDDFFNVFELYNLSVFPAQIFHNLLALFLIYAAIAKIKKSGRIVSAGLGFYWLWIGIVYHLVFFTRINPAAYVFGGLFIVQGVLFLLFGTWQNKLSFKFRKDWIGWVGTIFFMYSLIIYPLLGLLFEHTYPRNPTFGLPCPITIFTFGILLWSSGKVPIYMVIIPFAWSLIGFSAAVTLNVPEDFGLVVAGIVGSALILLSNKKIKSG